MLRKGVRTALFLGITLFMVSLTPDVWAAGEESLDGSENSEAEELRSELRRQEGALDLAVGELTDIGEELEESRWRVEDAEAHQKDLDRRTRELGAQLELQRDASARSRARLEERVRAAYRGEDLDGLMLVLAGIFGGGDARGDSSATLHTTRLLTESSRSMQDYKDAKQSLRSTLRQVEQSKAEYREYGEESRASVVELEGRESEMRASIEGLGLERDRLEERLAELEAEEEAGLLTRPPATGRGDTSGKGNTYRAQDWEDAREGRRDREEERDRQRQARDRELEIAQEDIVASPVEPIPYEEYVRLYKESAERYGFGGDWYVLAAVGKIESNHGENMGTSSAGAMGPMQFLPSTWASYGVDGDGDGEANIMDPEDAIPAAASYLRAGGAPDDWYAALFTYNRAGWYVEEVLAIAESYRRIHGDDTVGPYLKPAPTTGGGETPPRFQSPPQQEDAPSVREDSPGEDPPLQEAKPTVEKPRPTDDAPETVEKPQPTDDAPDMVEETTAPEPEDPAEGAETTERYQY